MQMSEIMKGALFDLDGVIADTAVYHFAAWRKLIKDHFDRELPDELEIETKGVSRQDSLKAILNYLQIEVSDEEFDQLCAEKNAAYVESLQALTPKDILPGIADLLSQLQDNNVKIALASASKNGPFILEKLGLNKVFAAVADPSKIAHGKPAPDIYLAAAAALDLQPSDCVGFEDAVAGVAAINAAKIVSVGIGSADELSQADLRFDQTADVSYNQVVKAWKQLHETK
ncbi:beta-phosphoglucomutase [Lactobacillus porci]|uniref:beta-phosphoglucomutase n=1 Tax=Lactobacillus porci TaxID=2012477 RepID=UPI003992E1D3